VLGLEGCDVVWQAVGFEPGSEASYVALVLGDGVRRPAVCLQLGLEAGEGGRVACKAVILGIRARIATDCYTVARSRSALATPPGPICSVVGALYSDPNGRGVGIDIVKNGSGG
jgi:hypothetical protein